MKCPCEDCIVFSICKSRFAINAGDTYLSIKILSCHLIKNFLRGEKFIEKFTMLLKIYNVNYSISLLNDVGRWRFLVNEN